MTVTEGDKGERLSSEISHPGEHKSAKVTNHVRHLHYSHIRRRKMSSAKVLASKKFTGLYTGPYFDPGMPNNITAQMGDTALITCNVNQIGKFQVLSIFIYTSAEIMIIKYLFIVYTNQLHNWK